MSWLSSFFNPQQAHTSGSPIDVIVYVASLASTPKEVDPLLDVLREITARPPAITGPDFGNNNLTEADQTALAKTYQQLEMYLTAKDPLRTITPQQLHEKIADKFTPDPAHYPVFWQQSGLSSTA